MSLINDALKRTKDVQQQTAPAASGPALRPAEPAQSKAGSGARTLLFIMVLAVVLGNFLLWMAFKDRDQQRSDASATRPVHARESSVPLVTPEPAVEPAAVHSVAPPPPGGPPVFLEAAAAAVGHGVSAGAGSTNDPAPQPRVVFAEPPKPAVLRLQSIIYGSRPSAMIAGKFLFVGDSIQGHQVIAIDKETVTLVGDGQTNILSLP